MMGIGMQWKTRGLLLCVVAWGLMLMTATSALAQSGEGETPAYLRSTDDLDRLDLLADEEYSPIQRVARQLARDTQVQSIRSLDDIQHLLSFEYTLQGASAEEIFHEAKTRALMSAAGRLYVGDYILLGRDLLEPYLRKNTDRFIARTTVLDERGLTDDRLQMTLRLSVNLDLFYADLEAKRFIATPELKPVIGVHLSETINGAVDTTAGGHWRIEQTLHNNIYRTFSEKMSQPAITTDVSASPELLRQARFEAQRNLIEVIVTGSLDINKVGDEAILFDDFTFYEATLDLKLYRVDTGELLGEVNDRYSAKGDAAGDSIANVLDVLVPRATQKLADKLNEDWTSIMFDLGKDRVMFVNIEEPENVPLILEWIESLAPGVRAYEKSYYGGVLVLNVAVPEGERLRVADEISNSTEPQFSIRQISDNRFEVEVL